MKYIHFYIALFLANFVFSQQKMVSFKQEDAKPKSAFSYINENNQLALFFSSKKYLSIVEFNDEFNVKDSLGVKINPKEVESIIGTTNKDQTYFVYWKTKKDNEIIVQSFDFKDKNVVSEMKSLLFEKEKIINKIAVNNKFYIITLTKVSNIVNFYCFNGNETIKKSIDCSGLKFIDSYNRYVSLWDLYLDNSNVVYSNMIENILDETPASLVNSTHKKKAYVRDNSLIFTFDTNEYFTQLIQFDLENYTVSQRMFPQPFIKEGQYDNIDSNSFSINDKLMQLKLDKTILYVVISDLNGLEIKKIVMRPDHDIEIKNSEIIQEMGSIKSTRVLETSNQLIRKIDNMNPSISCYFIDNKYYMTIGGVSFPRQTTESFLGGMGGLVGSLISVALTSNYSVNNLNSYADKKIVYLNSIFDENFNHLKGANKNFAFDRLRIYYEENQNYSAQTIFKLNGTLYLTGFDKKTQEYHFISFSE